jgi:hypothetical protein
MYRRILWICAACIIVPIQAASNPIELACNQSTRENANPVLCSCIGQVARETLTFSQMRQGARFFDNPQRAQDIRQSDHIAHETLWLAWRNFGEAAEEMCG